MKPDTPPSAEEIKHFEKLLREKHAAIEPRPALRNEILASVARLGARKESPESIFSRLSALLTNWMQWYWLGAICSLIIITSLVVQRGFFSPSIPAPSGLPYQPVPETNPGGNNTAIPPFPPVSASAGAPAFALPSPSVETTKPTGAAKQTPPAINSPAAAENFSAPAEVPVPATKPATDFVPSKTEPRNSTNVPAYTPPEETGVDLLVRDISSFLQGQEGTLTLQITNKGSSPLTLNVSFVWGDGSVGELKDITFEPGKPRSLHLSHAYVRSGSYAFTASARHGSAMVRGGNVGITLSVEP